MATYNINSSIYGIVGTSENDTINLYNSAIIKNPNPSGSFEAINSGAGDDVISFRDSASTDGQIITKSGNDKVYLSENVSISNVAFLNEGNDLIIMSGNSKLSGINLGYGADNVQVIGNASVGGISGSSRLNLYNSVDEGDTIIINTTGIISGDISVSSGADYVRIINGTLELYHPYFLPRLAGDNGNDTLIVENIVNFFETVSGGNNDDHIIIKGGKFTRVFGDYVNYTDVVWGNDTIEIYGNSFIVKGDSLKSASVSGGGADDIISIHGNAKINADISGDLDLTRTAYIQPGNDIITIYENATINSVSADYGNDVITVFGNAVANSLNAGNGEDTIIIRGNSKINGSVSGDPSPYNLGYGIIGNDTITISENAFVNGIITTWKGNDSITIAGNANTSNTDSGAGNDTITVSENATVSGTISGGADQDTFLLSGRKNLTIDGGTDTDASSDFDTLDITSLTRRYGAGTIEQTTDSDGDSTSGTITFAGGPTITFSEIELLKTSLVSAPCFTPGARISTINGLKLVEELVVGDLILTADHGYQTIRWIGKRLITAPELAQNPNLRPIRIKKGALGNCLPSRDLIVSPQHRMVGRNQIVERLFNNPEILIPAKHMLGLKGVTVARDIIETTYIHFVFDQHEIVYAENAPTESMYLGPMAIANFSSEALEEIAQIFPELFTEQYDESNYPVARPLVQNKLARNYISRTQKNGKSFYQGPSS